MSQAKRLSEEDKNTLRQTNAVEFVHTCMTVALHQEFGVGAQRLGAVNARRDEVNAEVLRFGAARLTRLHQLTVENFRQLNDWAQEDGLDVAMERLCRCARDAYKVDVWVEDVPDPEYLRQQRQETRQQMRELEAEAIRAEVSRMRVPNVLPLSGAEMERRIQSAQSARQMPERGRRR